MFYLIIFLIFIALVFNSGNKNKKKKQAEDYRTKEKLLKSFPPVANNASLLKQLDNHRPASTLWTEKSSAARKMMAVEDFLSSHHPQASSSESGVRLSGPQSHITLLPPRPPTITRPDRAEHVNTQAGLQQQGSAAQSLNGTLKDAVAGIAPRDIPLQALLKKINNPGAMNTTPQAIPENTAAMSGNELPIRTKKRPSVFSVLTFENTGIACMALSLYYPKRFQNLSLRDKVARNIVYDFKDGASESTHLSCVAKISAIIRQSLTETDRQNGYFFCLPASSQLRHDLRYRQFSKAVSTQCGMTDFNQFITFKHERNQKHIHGGVLGSEFAHVNIPYQQLAGKNVVIFDDIITSGRSLSAVSQRLRDCGAHIILAVFLAKTYNENYSDNIDKKHFVLTS